MIAGRSLSRLVSAADAAAAVVVASGDAGRRYPDPVPHLPPRYAADFGTDYGKHSDMHSCTDCNTAGLAVALLVVPNSSASLY